MTKKKFCIASKHFFKTSDFGFYWMNFLKGSIKLEKYIKIYPSNKCMYGCDAFEKDIHRFYDIFMILAFLKQSLTSYNQC